MMTGHAEYEIPAHLARITAVEDRIFGRRRMIADPAEYIADLRRKSIEFLWTGVEQGWWEDVDEEAMLPVRVFQITDFHATALMAHAWNRANTRKFNSIKEAKRAGWGMPIKAGTYRIGSSILRIEG